jgi:hypothetical protein
VEKGLRLQTPHTRSARILPKAVAVPLIVRTVTCFGGDSIVTVGVRSDPICFKMKTIASTVLSLKEPHERDLWLTHIDDASR